LLKFKKGRREEETTLTALAARLREGLRPHEPEVPEAEARTFEREVRLRCTEAMVLSLDRESRVAYLLSDVFGLSHEEGAAVLELPMPTYRKRVSRARERLHKFMRGWCGVYDQANPCRCRGQVQTALEKGRIGPDGLLFACHPVEVPQELERKAAEVEQLSKVAEVIRSHPQYAAPDSVVKQVKQLLLSERFELLR
jgi:hypothetical protein